MSSFPSTMQDSKFNAFKISCQVESKDIQIRIFSSAA